MNTCAPGPPKPGSPEGPGTFTPRTAYPPDVLQAKAVKLYATGTTNAGGRRSARGCPAPPAHTRRAEKHALIPNQLRMDLRSFLLSRGAAFAKA